MHPSERIPDLVALARRSDLQDSDWHELLERRVRHIRPYLKKDMVLRPLNEVPFLGERKAQALVSMLRSMKEDSPEVTADDGCDLRMRALFPTASNSWLYTHVEQELDRRTHRFWGLTKQGEWIGVEVHSIYMQPQDMLVVELAEKVSIRKLEQAEVYSFAQQSPKEIWHLLGKKFVEWNNDRKLLYERSRELAETFELEAQIVKHL